jgi:hypothetical protein
MMQMNTTGGQSASEVLASKIAEAIARGEDPLGDNDDPDDEGGATESDAAASEEADAAADVAAAAASQADGETDAAAAAGAEAAAADTQAVPKDEPALDAEALAAVAGDDLDVEPDVLQVSDKDFKAERQKLAAAEDAIEERWAKGELTDEDRRKELRGLRDQQTELIREETQAQTIADMNRQALVRHQTRVLTSLAADSKAAGQLDYSDAKVGAAYDRMLHAVAGDPANEGKTFQQLARLAHDALCAVRGVKAAPAPAAAASPAESPAAPAAGKRTTPAVPTTLRTLPSASTPNTGGDALDALANLKGQDYQDAFNRLSPAQKARMLDE